MMIERMASGWMTVWRLDARELKRSKDAASKMVKQRHNFSDIMKAKKCKSSALKEASTMS